MKKLPIGILTLKIRNEDYVYIDKSRYVANLFNSGGRYYFLSRTHRFGNNNEYHAYWLETATPIFLIQLIQNDRYDFPDLEIVIVNPEELNGFDVENRNVIDINYEKY